MEIEDRLNNICTELGLSQRVAMVRSEGAQRRFVKKIYWALGRTERELLKEAVKAKEFVDTNFLPEWPEGENNYSGVTYIPYGQVSAGKSYCPCPRCNAPTTSQEPPGSIVSSSPGVEAQEESNEPLRDPDSFIGKYWY